MTDIAERIKEARAEVERTKVAYNNPPKCEYQESAHIQADELEEQFNNACFKLFMLTSSRDYAEEFNTRLKAFGNARADRDTAVALNHWEEMNLYDRNVDTARSALLAFAGVGEGTK